ncbi:hypothetical protein HZC09_00580 [Candidatus Micrarchaeota archaeon]|nr:hypothetical protein [Candidatus Micrarchaeota archaeon]
MDKLLILGIVVGLLAVAGIAQIAFASGSQSITGKVTSSTVTATPQQLAQQSRQASAPAAVANPITNLPNMVGGC